MRFDTRVLIHHSQLFTTLRRFSDPTVLHPSIMTSITIDLNPTSLEDAKLAIQQLNIAFESQKATIANQKKTIEAMKEEKLEWCKHLRQTFANLADYAVYNGEQVLTLERSGDGGECTYKNACINLSPPPLLANVRVCASS